MHLPQPARARAPASRAPAAAGPPQCAPSTPASLPPPPAAQLTLVGKIKGVTENATRMMIQLEDSTGNIEVMFWIPQDDTDFVGGPAARRGAPALARRGAAAAAAAAASAPRPPARCCAARGTRG
jgi:hypothetical protein